jgi:Trypsin-like peptidase domain
MILRRFVWTVVVSSCLSVSGHSQGSFPGRSTSSHSSEHGQDFSQIVLPITSVKVTPVPKLGITGGLGPGLDMDAKFGTGFCLDPKCRFIVTNYHVAAITPVRKIKDERIFQRYLATGPHDRDATWNTLASGEKLPYAVKRDLAIFELRHPLSHHHGLTLSIDEIEIGQEVDIYGYPKGIINPVRKLTRFPATFKGPTISGLLGFEYQLPADKPIRIGGASGGIVVDRKTEKILGILSETTGTMALAVPVQTLVDFVNKVEPFLAQQIFANATGASPVPADLYPKFAPSPDRNSQFVPVHSGELEHRPEEPAEVKELRQRAQLLADNMRNFIAVQSLEWGSANKEPAAVAKYEVQVIDGAQRFREYPDGKEELGNAEELDQVRFPPLNAWALGANEWSMLPTMVGTELRLKVHQAANAVVNERLIKVFQYYASVEDNMCPFQPIVDFVFFKLNKIVVVACYGEVWTDVDTNIIRISEHLDLSEKLKDYRGWEEYQMIVTYGWLKLADESPALVPLTIFTEGRHGKKSVFWCRGQFTNYRMFTSRSKMAATTATN